MKKIRPYDKKSCQRVLLHRKKEIFANYANWMLKYDHCYKVKRKWGLTARHGNDLIAGECANYSIYSHKLVWLQKKLHSTVYVDLGYHMSLVLIDVWYVINFSGIWFLVWVYWTKYGQKSIRNQ